MPRPPESAHLGPGPETLPGGMKSISVFEIIKPGIGPSSSHTMGPWRAAELFLDLLREQGVFDRVTGMQIDLYGSLAKTGLGHGTELAVLMGLSGEDFRTVDTRTLPDRVARIRAQKTLRLQHERDISFDPERDLVFNFDTTLERHPNGLQFAARSAQGPLLEARYYSVGGGFVVREGESDSDDRDAKVTPYPCHTARAILENCRRLNVHLSELVFLNEQTWRTPDEIRAAALGLWDEMKQCVFRGVNKGGLLPGVLRVRRRAHELNTKFLGQRSFPSVDHWLRAIRGGPRDFSTVNRWITTFALAVNEENASFGRVVTAPTNGAAGVIPAVLLYAHCFTNRLTDDRVVDFLLTAGEIGTLYKKGSTLSAAMGGCQAEIGVSSSMAAAGLAEVLGGTKEQVLQAAEIAMEHHLGLTCDPIAGLVQVPCIERNAMGAIKAVTAANLALDEDPSFARVSLDDVIKTMWATARDMNSKYKETSEGGLAAIPVNVIEC